ncbi:TIGR01244 family phosphatase [Sphingobium phenoxybenzoativorans]|uniref:TIGR01244 family phosphatase n=1 Tax=Sphingobium phenoxybenzoativorans TaxID=1592790 RepID=A0A975K9K0_9SPHN|nr:TIGR01244 family sulfur transferase [Sphingobium phenoxybenzoativorans]QUT06543.1 TIGR01244 family phosphatase [Sphingobium phenoxybenzoativorans]
MFRQVTDTFFVSPQITVEDVAEAKALGAVMVINNRPEGEEAGQTPAADIEAAARAAGLDYAEVPVTHAGFFPWQLDGMAEALAKAGDGKVLAYCRSGTRSTLLWALTQARAGGDPDALAAKAAGAGYDLSPIRQIMDALAAEGK